MLTELLYYVLITGTIVYTLYKWLSTDSDYFKRRNLSHLDRKWFGNTVGLYLRQYIPAEFMDKLYYSYPKEKLIGFFDMLEPTYFARDAEVIRQVTIKEFDSFEDRVILIDNKSDTLLGRSVFLMSESEWREMRTTLSPAFTGSKMRHMFELVVECADDMSAYLLEEARIGQPIRWEMRDLFSRYTSDVIGSCAFGLKINSLKERNNEFFTIGMNSLNFGTISVALRLFFLRTMPKLMRAINFEFFPAHVKRFFKSMVLNTMSEREKRQIYRPDMIQILMQVRSGNLKQQNVAEIVNDTGFATVNESNIGKVSTKRIWSEDEIIAQCFIFFAAGFDTASTLISFLFYELAADQVIQDKLYMEIQHVHNELNGARLSYDTLSKMKYMDQVVSEALRKWPPAIFTNRKCTRDCELDLDGKKIFIERGKSIWIPIVSIHNDPEIYKNPKKFDPERFNDENKQNIKAGTYIPFGSGPRNCIGSRFALMEIKALCFHLLLNFNVQAYEKTQIPLKLVNTSINWKIENGIHLELKPRQHFL